MNRSTWNLASPLFRTFALALAVPTLAQDETATPEATGQGLPSACSPSVWAATTIKVPSSHVAMVSHPDAVASLIEMATESFAVK